ncbi:MAG TPA: acyltransferase family protein, partial [Pyrinomonadaceae bacterium]
MKELISSRLKSIDALRGLAALAVVVYHAATALEVLPSNALWFRIVYAIPSHGHLGVALFFVISGYVLSYRLLIHTHNRSSEQLLNSLASSTFRRGMRLYGSATVALLI